MADSSIIENLSEGVLTAFFGSFLGAAVGKDLAGITVNLLSSGIEKIGAKTFETITQDRTNHDIQKLASASLYASINDVLSENNDIGGKVTWRDSQKKALSELREYAKSQFMSDTEIAGRIVGATMVGLPAEVENSVKQMIQPFLEQKDTIDKERLTQEISKRFFFNFNELYKSEKHEKGRLAIERDIARTLLQGLNSQTAIIADFKQKNQSQYETVVRLLDRIVTTGLTDWNPNFDKVINAVNNLATESKEQIKHIDSRIVEIKEHQGLSHAEQMQAHSLTHRKLEEALQNLIPENDGKNEIAVREAKAFEAGRLLMGTFIELQIDPNYNYRPFVERAAAYLGDLNVRDVDYGIMSANIDSSKLESLCERINQQLWSRTTVARYFETSLHLFMTLHTNDLSSFKSLVYSLDIPASLKVERRNTMEWLADLRSHFEGILFPKQNE